MDLHTIKVVLELCVPFFLMTFWAVLHASSKNFGTLQAKALWMMTAAIPFVGFIIYLIFGFRKASRKEKDSE